MCRKMYFSLCAVLLLSMGTISFAADYVWNNSVGDGNWNNSLNWTPNVVPGTGTSYFARIRTTSGPVFNGQTASVYRIYLETANNGTLTINSGSLSTVNHIYAGQYGVDRATINMNGGSLTIGGTFYVARDSGSIANINLSAGTISCNNLLMCSNGGSGGTINIEAGTLIIAGDVRNTLKSPDLNLYVPGYTDKGWIKAYSGAGTFNIDYDVTNPGKTTVTASPPTKAAAPTPADGATNVTTLQDLSWFAMLDATSHDVYFGTTNPPPFQGNQTGLTFDPGLLTGSTQYFWQIDEITPGGTVTGDVWSFTTGNTSATRPSPADAATNVSLSAASLVWKSGVSATSHDIYFGTENPPPFYVHQDTNNVSLPMLGFRTTYYWRVDEIEGSNTYTGPTWSFTSADPISKGPYLIYPGNNTQMTVLWQLPITQGCTLDWGTDTSYSGGSTGTTEYGTGHQHKYTITGLTPGTKYYYRVITPWTTATGSFRSAPASDATSVKFLAYGDTRTYPASHAAVAAGINSLIAGDAEYQTVLLHSGDYSNIDDEITWTNEYFSRQYPATLEMMAAVPIMGCLGNHEINAAIPAAMIDKYYPYAYPEPANGRYYSFDYGPVHIAVIDQETSSYTSDSAQILWLTNDLASTTKKWKILMFHAPGWSAYGPGSHPNDATVQAVIQPLCVQYGVQVVLNGHNHFYSRAVVDGVHHVTTGGGGASNSSYNIDATRPNIVAAVQRTLEFCKINVTPNTLSVQAIATTGAVLDSFSVTDLQPDLTFVQVTDVQIGMCTGADARWQQAIRKINIANPAFVIDTGDHVQNWSVSSPNTVQLATYKSIATGLKPGIPIYHAPGNHDIGDTPTAERYASFLSMFPNPFPESSSSSLPYYSFSYGNTLFICLDTLILKDPNSWMGQDVNEMNWLTTTLQNSGGYDHKIVFTHVSICKTSVTEATDGGGFNMPNIPGRGRAYDDIRGELLSLFHQYGVEVVICGHAHVPYYANDYGLDLITTESSTCPLGSLLPNTCGIRIFKVYPDHIDNSYRTYLSIPDLIGDFNGDNIVDFKDIASMACRWLNNNMWP